MSLGYNPVIKFQPSLKTREGLRRIADKHNLGHSGPSENEVTKLITTQFAEVHPENFFLALAALHAYRHKFPKGHLSPTAGLSQPI